jgi:iron complex transport system substrate-binding protein
MPQAAAPPLTRRRLLAAGGAAGLGALLAACGDPSPSGSGGNAWSFTDDRRKKAIANHRPRRVVAYVGAAAALHDFGVGRQIVGVFGPTRLKNGHADPLAGDLDVHAVTVLGNAWGEFNVEKYAALRPDLLVTNMYLPDDLWFVPAASRTKILALAPSVAFTAAKVSLPEPIRRYASLAAALGADPKAGKVTAARDRFDRAVDRLLTTAAAHPGVRVMAASASPDLFYVSDPRVYADLSYFRDLGVDMVVPERVDSAGFFEDLSWENADKYAADLILLDSRTAGLQPKDLTGKPSWTALPAVAAGQVVPWLSEPRFSYAGCAPVLEGLADALARARPVRRPAA